MSEVGPDLDLDADLSLDLDGTFDTEALVPDDITVSDSAMIDGGSLQISQPPDPLATSDVAPVKFGQTIEFPDGTHVDDAHTDAQGYIYKSRQDWIDGTNKHVADE